MKAAPGRSGQEAAGAPVEDTRMEEPSDLKKADSVKRFAAAVIDAIVAVLIGLIPLVGAPIAAAYVLLRDGLDLPFMDRRSVGKKLAGLRPVRIDGGPMDAAASFKRNWVFVLGVFLWPLIFIPVLGWILIILLVIPVGLASLVLFAIEAFLALADDRGRRLGDRTAGTQVVEAAP